MPVKLAKVADWDRLEELFGSTDCPANGQSGEVTRLMVALYRLKYTHTCSDEGVVEGWVDNPYSVTVYVYGVKIVLEKDPGVGQTNSKYICPPQ